MSLPLPKLSELKRQPKKLEICNGGYRHQNRFYSRIFKDECSAYLKEYPSADTSPVVVTEVKLYSSQYSQDKFSREVIWLFSEIERVFFVNLKVLPLGFEVFCDDRAKSLKARFYFLNYNKFDECKSFNGELSKSVWADIQNKISSKIGNFRTLSFNKFSEQDETDIIAFSDGEVKSTFELVSLLGDVDCRNAVARALRGLPANKSERLLMALNQLIEVSGDGSVKPIKRPKKFSKDIQQKGSTISLDMA